MMEGQSLQKRKGIKFLLIIFLVVFLYLFINELEVNAAEGDTIATGTTGSCTYTLTELSTGNYSLTISGSGAMYNYSWSGSVPWYKYRTQIEEINIEDGVTTIENYVFYGCELLENIEIPSSVTSIGNYAFYNCTSLTSIKIPSSITSIGNFAFYNCSSLISIEIPSSVTSIGRPVFSGCCSLTNIGVDNENISYISQDGILYNKDMTELICFPAGKTDTRYTIPSTVTSIEWDAFYQCISLVEIDLSNCISLTNIDTGAFYSCTSLKEIDLSNCTELTSIGWTAFKYCTSLTEIDLSNCTLLTYIDSETFENCISMVSIKLPRGITGIGGTAFASCYSLESIDLSNMVALEYMGSYAFANCTSLKSVDLSNCTKLSYIYEGIFINCYNLETIDFEGDVSLSSIEYYNFFNCENLKQIDLSSCTSLTSIGWGSFEYCELLENVILPTSVKEIGWYAFYHCSSLKNINLYELTSLTSIKNYAFYCCTRLENIKLSSSIGTIGDFAFYFCSLQSIDLSECKQLESIGGDAFYQMPDSADYVIDMSLPKDTYFYAGEGALSCTYLNYSMIESDAGYYYVDSNGVAWKYDSDSNEAYLAYISSEIEAYEVPSVVTINETEYDVKGINNLALFYAKDLTEISFENASNITKIDTYAFAYCNTLEKINEYTTIEEIKNSFDNATLESTAVEATKISTTYNLYVEIDLTDYSPDMEEWIKDLVETGDLTQVTLQLYCNGEILEEQTINLDSDTTYYYYTFEDLSIENEYYVDIAHNNAGYGANILYGYTGNTTPTYAWINIGTKYAYTVTLDLDEENSNGEIYSIDIEFLDEDGNLLETATLSEENNWTYVFYIEYINNRYYSYIYNQEIYKVAVIEDDNYDFEETTNYEETIESENYENDTSCYNSTYSLYSYSSGATISLVYDKYSDIIVHHYIYDETAEDPCTETQVPSNDGETVEDETNTGIVGDEYTTSVSDKIAYNYEYVSDTENTTGVYVSGETIEIIYYYKMKDAKITSEITKEGVVEDGTAEGATSVTDEEQTTISYDISYTTSIDEYIGDGTITIVDTLPYEIEDNYTYTITVNGDSTSIIPIYDSEDEEQTLTWQIPIEDIDTYDEDGNSVPVEIKVEISLTVTYKDINYGADIENKAIGTLELTETNQIDEVEDDKTIPVEIKTEVTVSKTWKTKDDVSNLEATINLYRDGSTEVYKTTTITGNNSYTFEELDKYDTDGHEYVYTAEEAEITGYTSEVDNTGLNFTNTSTIPSLSVEKTANIVEDAKVGNEIIYTMIVTNIGYVELTNIDLTDTITVTENETQVEKTLTVYENEACTIEVSTISSLGVGESKTVYTKYIVTQDDVDSGETIINKITVESEEGAKGEDDAETTTINGESSLNVEKTANITENAKLGDEIIYTIKIENTGNVTLKNTNLSDIINTANGEESLTLYSDEDCTAGNEVTTIARIEVGASATVYTKYEVTQDDIDNGTTIINAITAINGTITKADTAKTKVEDADPAIDVEKTASITQGAKVGDEITYTIKVENTGNVTLENIMLTDEITKVTEEISSEDRIILTLYIDKDCTEENEISSIEKLEVGASIYVYATYTVTQDDIDSGTTIVNTITASTEEVTGTDTAETDVEDKNPAIDVEKTADIIDGAKVGDIVTYTINITNTGNVTLKNVNLTDKIETANGESSLTLYSNKDCTQGKEITNIGSLAVGENVNVYAKYEITQDDIDNQIIILNTATATDGNVEDQDSATTTPEGITLGIDVEKQADKTEDVKVGDEITYTIKVTNTGNATLTNVELTDVIGTNSDTEKTNLTVYRDENCTSGNEITTISSLGVGESTTVYAKYVVTQDDIDAQTQIVNTVTAKSGSAEDEDTAETTPTKYSPEMNVEKIANITQNAKAGDEIIYTINVTNTGYVTLTDVELLDIITLSSGEEELTVYYDEGCSEGNEVSSIDRIEVGETLTIYAKYTVTQSDIDNQTEIKNTVTATVEDQTKTSTATTTVEEANPDITVNKTASILEEAEAGDEITYSILITNSGNITICNIELVDTITISNGESNLTLYKDQDCTEGNEITEIESIGVGEIITLYAKYTVTDEDMEKVDSIVNTVIATSGELTASSKVETTLYEIEEEKEEEEVEETDTTLPNTGGKGAQTAIRIGIAIIIIGYILNRLEIVRVPMPMKKTKKTHTKTNKKK